MIRWDLRPQERRATAYARFSALGNEILLLRAWFWVLAWDQVQHARERA